MNSFKLLVICLFCIHNAAGAKDRIVDRPPFIAWSSDVMEINKVALSDTATVLHVKAFFQPKYWLKIHSNSYLLADNGEKYTLRSALGIIPDTEFIIPESGEREFALIFPSLPDNVSVISFFEGNAEEDSWKIWGIRVRGKHPKVDIPSGIIPGKYAKEEILPQPVLVNGNAQLKGKVLDFMPGMDRKIMLYTQSAIGYNTKGIELELQEDGSFTKEIQVTSVTPASIHLFNTSINLFLAPYEQTNLYINTREICRSESRLRKKEKSFGKRVYYDGYLAGLSDELEKSPVNTSVIADYQAFFDEIENKNMEEVKEILLANHQRIIQQIDALKISNAAKKVLKTLADNSVVYHICSTSMLVKQAYAISNKLSDEEIAAYFTTPMQEPYHFYDVLKEYTGLNELHALYASNYSSIFSIPGFDQLYSKALGVHTGSYFELYTINNILNSLEDLVPLTAKQERKLRSLTSSAYLELATQKNKEVLATLEDNKQKAGFTIHSVSEVTNEDLFAYLISGFRGKIVVIDFWATWCGPCLLANKMMKPMKEQIEDKDIVYLYLTGENSPENKWENMKSDLPGVHFRLSNEQWNYLCNKFNVSGIPSYLIVDRKGEIMYTKVGFPGVDAIKTELEKLLAKE